ncbi:MAG: DUF427 domain-containing protein [Myxococcota bacterium]
MPPPRDEPGPGQESVWDYPRPPALIPYGGKVQIFDEETVLAETTGAYRVLETSHPPTFYLPPADIRMDLMTPAPGSSICEWKGQARYFHVDNGSRRLERVAWAYPSPTPAFAKIADFLCFYPSKVRCFVDGEGVKAQEGDFYGGWITSRVVGPFKGGPGTWGW